MSYISVVLIIGVLILVHELGHLLTALRLGIPVKRFSIGMGPVLKRFKYKDVEYCLGLLPIGGYVSLKVEEDKEFFKIPPGQRIGFALGGPLANILFALPLFALINVLSSGFSMYGVFVYPFVQTATISLGMLEALKMLVSSPEQLSSVVGIVAQGGEYVSSNLINLLKLMVLLSLNLAILNLLPIPVLDGGQVLLTLLEKVTPKVIPFRVPLAVAGWMFIIGLMIYATIMDVSKLT